MKINLKQRFSNKAFLAAFAAAVILLLLSMLGIIVDPTTKGVGDSQAILDGESSDSLKDEIEELNNMLDAREDELKEMSDKLGALMDNLQEEGE